MLGTLKRYAMLVLDPPWERDGPETFTLAVPQAHSTFKTGGVGWPNRPPAVVTCPACESHFTQQFANDFIDCPHCWFECSPDEFADLELVGLACPNCRNKLDHGVRHPELVDVPEWASCEECQYHWEYQHDFETE